MSYKKHEIPIPEKLLSKYRMKGVTYRAFNYLEGGVENQRIEMTVNPDIVLEEIKKPQMLELGSELNFSYSEMEKIFNSVSEDFRKRIEKLKIKSTPEAKRMIMNIATYIVRAMTNGQRLQKELFDE